MDLCFGIDPKKKAWTVCQGGKVYFCLAHFGWPHVCIASAAKKQPVTSLSVCFLSETISDYFRKNTTRDQSGSSGIFLRHFRMYRL